jgi:nitroimidazol reductase NimA-like FMN-containing flavoprotein (pyridoxamine 5'-phosphate oxidase superfamily)
MGAMVARNSPGSDVACLDNPAMDTTTWGTDRSRVRRKPERASYDAAAVFAVVDEAMICHLGVVRDGCPVVLPTIHARLGETVYLHGSPAAGFVRDGRRGTPVCLSFTLVDGYALTRSARTHSLNYRSAVVFGSASVVKDQAEKLAALEAITNHVVPGRWDVVRQADEDDMRATEVLAVTIEEASFKGRSGGPLEDDSRGLSTAWAGVIPITAVRGAPEPAPFVDAAIPAPAW